MDNNEQILLKALVQMIWADGEVDRNEQAMLGQILAQLGIDADEIAQVGELMKTEKVPDADSFREQVPDPEDRFEMLSSLVAMAAIDGEISFSEVVFLKKMAEVLEISQEQLQELQDEAMEAIRADDN